MIAPLTDEVRKSIAVVSEARKWSKEHGGCPWESPVFNGCTVARTVYWSHLEAIADAVLAPVPADIAASARRLRGKAEPLTSEMAEVLFADLAAVARYGLACVPADETSYPVSNAVGPCGTPKCPECGNSLQNELIAGISNVYNCEACKLRWVHFPQTDND